MGLFGPHEALGFAGAGQVSRAVVTLQAKSFDRD
jgi:hypothetical protein